MRFVFYEYLGAAENKNKQTKNKRRLPQCFTRVAEQCAFWQRNPLTAWAWPLPQNPLS